MEHLNVPVAPGETVTLEATEPMYQNVSEHKLAREQAPCDRCPSCHGLITGKDMAVVLSLCLVVVAIGVICAVCCAWSQKATHGSAGLINPIARDTRLRIDQLYERITQWADVDPIMIMALALTLFAPVLVLLIAQDDYLPRMPAKILRPFSVTSDDTAVVTSRAKAIANISLRPESLLPCSSLTCLRPDGTLAPCGQLLLSERVDFSDNRVDDLNLLFVNTLPWNSANVYAVCADITEHCPFDAQLTSCQARLEKGHCVFDKPCSPKELWRTRAEISRGHLPASYYRLAELLSARS